MIDWIREDDFVRRVVKDPSDPPDTLFLAGFLGRAADEGHTRVYLDVMLAAYVDVPDAAILHAQPMPSSQSPLGGHYVWIERDHELVQRVGSARNEMLQVHQTFLNEVDGDSSLSAAAPGWPTIPT